MQIRPNLDQAPAYAPITTPFGYYGSTFTPQGRIGGLNFSLWSYGRGSDAPPTERLSHLLALGSPRAVFGTFGHEGTGVNVKKWNPYQGSRIKIQTLALRRETGPVYDTFYAYFLDPKTQRWRLYAAGRKYSGGKTHNVIRHPGAFIEVPGPPQRQRTGDLTREIHFRGWTHGSSGKWYPFTTMSAPSHATGHATKKWWITDDGWFAMRMGGLAYRDYDKTKGAVQTLPRKSIPSPLPDFLSPTMTKPLFTTPASITLLPINDKGTTHAQIPFTLTGTAKPGKVHLYWGRKDALTFAERWKHSTKQGNIKPGENTTPLDELEPDTHYYYRILFENPDGRIWSLETGELTTRAR